MPLDGCYFCLLEDSVEAELMRSVALALASASCPVVLIGGTK